MAKRQEAPTPELPHDPLAETAVIASCLIDPSKVTQVAEIITPDDFYSPENRAAFASFLRLKTRGEPVNDPVCYMAELRRHRQNIPDPMAFVAEMQQSIYDWVTGDRAEHYARAVAEAAKRRFLLLLAGRIREWVSDPNRSARWIANRIVREIQDRAKQKAKA